MKYEYLHPRDELVLTMQRIYRYKMTTTSGGNLSILDENGDIWITPTGIDKGTLTPNDIVCMRADGRIEGLHRPSSEYPFHKAIYAVRRDIRAIVHAHPMALVAFSIAHKVPDTRLFHQAWRSNGTVAFAPYGTPGSEDLGNKIAQKFAEGLRQCHPRKPRCLLRRPDPPGGIPEVRDAGDVLQGPHQGQRPWPAPLSDGPAASAPGQERRAHRLVSSTTR